MLMLDTKTKKAGRFELMTRVKRDSMRANLGALLPQTQFCFTMLQRHPLLRPGQHRWCGVPVVCQWWWR